jgi:hypothetical protein
MIDLYRWIADPDVRLDAPRMQDVNHSHCPDGHPQPVLLDDGRELCGRCLFRFGEACIAGGRYLRWVFEEVEMVPCTPETCEEP